MSRKPSPSTSPVTAATMPSSFTTKSLVHVPSLEERADLALHRVNLAMGVLALVYATHECANGRRSERETYRELFGVEIDPVSMMRSAGRALVDAHEELYWLREHPDPKARTMPVPTDEDWQWYKRESEKAGAQ
jgi:hypothetical protein